MSEVVCVVVGVGCCSNTPMVGLPAAGGRVGAPISGGVVSDVVCVVVSVVVSVVLITGASVGIRVGAADGNAVWNSTIAPELHENPSLLENRPAPDIGVE